MDESMAVEGYELNLGEIIHLIFRRLWIILLVGAFFATGAYGISEYLLTPTYESTTKIYVMNRQDSSSAITYTDLQTGSQLTKDYMLLITSRPVTETVIERLGLNLKHKDLVNMITVTNPSNTRILEITVEYTDPMKVKEIADAIREEASLHISTVMNIERVSLAEEANYPEGPSGPNTLMNMIIATILGFMLTAGIIILRFMMDDTIKSSEDIEKYLDLSVLGAIPMEKSLGTIAKKERKRKRR